MDYKYLILTFFIIISLSISQEILCNDGIDNDGDSFIDCDDVDCTFDINCGLTNPYPLDLKHTSYPQVITQTDSEKANLDNLNIGQGILFKYGDPRAETIHIIEWDTKLDYFTFVLTSTNDINDESGLVSCKRLPITAKLIVKQVGTDYSREIILPAQKQWQETCTLKFTMPVSEIKRIESASGRNRYISSGAYQIIAGDDLASSSLDSSGMHVLYVSRRKEFSEHMAWDVIEDLIEEGVTLLIDAVTIIKIHMDIIEIVILIFSIVVLPQYMLTRLILGVENIRAMMVQISEDGV